VEYVELSDAQVGERFSELLGFAEERDLAYPLIAINGQLRLAGSAHYFRVLPLVETALAEEQVSLQEPAPTSS